MMRTQHCYYNYIEFFYNSKAHYSRVNMFNNSSFTEFSFQADPGYFPGERGQVGGTKIFLLVISSRDIQRKPWYSF